MHVISKKTLVAFWEEHPNAKAPLQAWYAEASRAAWETPQEIIALYNTARAIGEKRVIFNIGGNNFRLVVLIRYDTGVVFIRFIGTHSEYDKIDAETI